MQTLVSTHSQVRTHRRSSFLSWSIGSSPTARVPGPGQITMREDEFGMLEEGLRVFISELMSGHAAREQATAELLQAREELEQKLALIEVQRLEIHALSTPILDVWDDVLAVPLVGALDHARALEITEKLLAQAEGDDNAIVEMVDQLASIADEHSQEVRTMEERHESEVMRVIHARAGSIRQLRRRPGGILRKLSRWPGRISVNPKRLR